MSKLSLKVEEIKTLKESLTNKIKNGIVSLKEVVANKDTSIVEIKKAEKKVEVKYSKTWSRSPNLENI